MSFVHLHAHSEYSMLDGASRVGDMFDAAAAAGMPACAITDHGVMYGALEFYKRGTRSGVKPILGMEGYLFDGNRREKPDHRARQHRTDLSPHATGGRRPGLQEPHEDLVAGLARRLPLPSPDRLGPAHGVQRGAHLPLRMPLRRDPPADSGRRPCGRPEQGRAIQGAIRRPLLSRAPGPRHPGPEAAERRAREDRTRAGHPLGVHERFALHPQGGRGRPRCSAVYQHRFRTLGSQPLQVRFRRVLPEVPRGDGHRLRALARRVRDHARGRRSVQRRDLDGEPAPSPVRGSAGTHPRDLPEGARARGGWSPLRGGEWGPGRTGRVRAQGHRGHGFRRVLPRGPGLRQLGEEPGDPRGPGAGSAAGSIVSYALGITELDPLAYDLMFERFLNPERIAMPDIDIDFDERKRGDVIRYVQDKYGSDHVAQIVTYGTIKGRQSIRDAARVLGFPYMEGDRLTKMYPALIMGRDSGLGSALETSHEMREAYEAGGAAKEIIDTALKIENLKRSAGIHAAGVVIGRDPLVEHLPLKRGDHGEVVTQFDMNGVEELGLLKMDFLGLRNLTVIDLTRSAVKVNREIDIDVDSLDLADPKVYEMLRRGDSDGVFQLESEGMRRLLVQLKPDRFEQIMALIALYRPGPMEQIPSYIERKNDPSKIVYLHPALEDITKETYGVLVYQEQIVLMLQKLAGYTPGQADLVRKAIGKKKRDIMAAEEPRFIEGCANSGLTEREAKNLWSLIQPFADYSFNRAHSASYAYVAYQTAWLKAHFPVEYMAALLTSVKDRKDDKPKYLGMSRKMGIPVLIPDVNSSEMDFTPVGESIRFGLSAVRHVGEGVVERIIEARKAKGDFASFFDFCRRVDYQCLNKKTLESLVKSGAFESLNHTRKGLLDKFESISAEIIEQRKQEEAGQFSLWGGGTDVEAARHTDTPVSLEEHPKDILLAQEKEMLGLYVSDHPLLGVEGLLARMCDCSLAALVDRTPGDILTVGGLIATVNKRVTRKGDIMMLLQLEDLTGSSVEIILFNSTYEKFSSVVRPDAILLVKGRLDQDARDDSLKIIAMELHEPRLEERPFEISVEVDLCTPKLVDDLKEILANHPGSTQVFLHLDTGERTTVLRLGTEYCVDTSNGLYAELKANLGSSLTITL